MLRRIISYNISESFNVVRWCIAVIAFAFVAVVSVAKYVELSNMAAITFSSLETTYLILNDPTNIAYIYLPLYLFLICGIMFDDNFGTLEVIKCRSRRNWIISKYTTLLFYTVMYFVVLFVMNFLISDQVFPYSQVWSSDFVNVQVLMGQSPKNFVFTPLVTIGLSLASMFSLYLCAGTCSVVFSLVTNREADALFLSLGIGIILSTLFVFVLDMTSQMSVQAFGFRNGILWAIIFVLCTVAYSLTNRRDFNMSRRQ